MLSQIVSKILRWLTIMDMTAIVHIVEGDEDSLDTKTLSGNIFVCCNFRAFLADWANQLI